jgi:hypothetical protein
MDNKSFDYAALPMQCNRRNHKNAGLHPSIQGGLWVFRSKSLVEEASGQESLHSNKFPQPKNSTDGRAGARMSRTVSRKLQSPRDFYPCPGIAIRATRLFWPARIWEKTCAVKRGPNRIRPRGLDPRKWNIPTPAPFRRFHQEISGRVLKGRSKPTHQKPWRASFRVPR